MLTHIKKMMSGGAESQPPVVSTKGPALSLVVIVYDMPMQAEKTLYSLTADYQQGVEASDYEVIVVENESANNLDRCSFSSSRDKWSNKFRRLFNARHLSSVRSATRERSRNSKPSSA